MLERAFCALKSGATVVTRNRRLARTLRQAFGIRQQKRGREAWSTPDILPWNAWLVRLWDTFCQGDVLLLSPLQEQLLWEETVLETHAALMQPGHAARLAHEAWNLVHTWRIPRGFDSSSDVAAFSEWSNRYALRCERNHWVDGARVPDRLIALAREIEFNNEVLLVGFDELTPQQRDLAAAFNCVAIPAPGNERTQKSVQVECVDTKAEMLAAACWARALIADNAEQRIGVVVPGLQEKRAAIEAVFADVFHPASALPDAAARTRAFNISLAPPLSNAPVIAAALSVIEFMRGDPQLRDAGRLLRSPFISGAQSEMSQRALLDARLAERRELIVPLDIVLWHARQSAPIFAERLALLRHVSIEGLRRAGDWPALFRALLQAAGWPGDRVLHSSEFQALESWNELLAEFCSLDRILPALDYKEATARLRRFTEEKLFQPESSEVPVQILGVREALGQSFDHAWMMGLHDEAWPARCSPNPFIPLALQRKFGVPHATPERELIYAKAALQAVLASADDVVLSWPRRDGDVELAPSRLIVEFPRVTETAARGFTLYRDVIHRAKQIERLDDDYGARLTERVVRSAGNRLFEYQAACPFKAFAAFRLGARRRDEPAFGVDALARGNLAHKAIAAIWNELKTHPALIAANNLPQIVSAAVEQVVSEEARRRPRTFTPACAALEKRRLKALMLEWLEIDRARPPFESVECEVKQTKTVAGVTVNLRIDRIDRMQDGSVALVDYKTGQCDVKDWFSDRPAAPQLPLYAYGAEDVAAISYGVLRRGEVGYAGYSRNDGVAAGIDAAENWDAMGKDWGRVLEGLARQFLSGAAHVDPKKFPDTCGMCEMAALCRVAERGAKSDD